MRLWHRAPLCDAVALIAAITLVTGTGSTVSADDSATTFPKLAGIHYLQMPSDTTEIGSPAIQGSTVAFERATDSFNLERLIETGDVYRWHIHHAFVERKQAVPFDLNLVSLSKRWLVWVEYGSKTWSIRARNRANGRTYLVDSSKGKRNQPLVFWHVPLLSLDGDAIAWSYPTCVAHCTSVKAIVLSYIMVRQLPTGRPRIAVESTGACAANWPSLSGRTLVWEEEGIALLPVMHGVNGWPGRTAGPAQVPVPGI